jgi:predicted Zn-dependent protease
VARAGKLVASGLYEHAHRSMALGTSAGLLAYHAETEASADDDDAHAGRQRERVGRGHVAPGGGHRRGGVAQRAADKAEMSQGGGPALTPGPYTVVLEAQAVADLLGFLVLGAAGARGRRGAQLLRAAGRQRDRRGAVRRAGQAVVGPAATRGTRRRRSRATGSR